MLNLSLCGSLIQNKLRYFESHLLFFYLQKRYNMNLIDDLDKKINDFKKNNYKKYLELKEQFIRENPRSRINTPVKTIEIDYLIENLHEELNKNQLLNESFIRNKTLIELSEQTIPENLWNNVLTQYKTYDNVKPDFINILTFLQNNNLRSLQDKIEEFF